MSEPAVQGFFSSALTRARAARAAGDLPGAWHELRAGLDASLDYSQAVAAARFLENTAKGTMPEGWPPRRVALIGADTLGFLGPVVRALAFRDGWWPVFYEAPFGVWRQEILDAHSDLRQFQPEITFVLRGWRSINEETFASTHLLEEERALAGAAAIGLGLVLWPGYDLPAAAPLKETLAQVNAHLRAALPPALLWVDLAEVQTRLGADWEDERLWQSARQHPSPGGCLALVEAWLALLRARWGKMRKVLVTDLDNVLWGGIVGEDGTDGLRTGPATSEGRVYSAYQDYLLELKKQGVLLAVCSKNNEADVSEVFPRRQLPLRREDFAGWQVNWRDKADNLRALAAELNVGLESFVFVDDQPAERERVRAALPEVAVPELPEDPAQFVPCLRARRFFETLGLTAEDRNRAASYAARAQAGHLRASATSLADFLQGLEMVAEHGPFDESTLDRVEQLLARTNQWNLTTRRHPRAEIQAFLRQPGALTQWFRLRDRFGDHGLVGLWMARPCGGGEWEIDSWVMSCRVIGRGLEDLMFNTLVDAARQAGACRLRGVFRPTAKNGLAAGFLPGLRFVPVKNSTTANDAVFVLELSSAKLRQHFIHLAPAKNSSA